MYIIEEIIMSNNKNRSFPDSYPKNLLDCIIKDGAGQNTYANVYRVSDDGTCNRDAFLCTAIQNLVYGVCNRDAYLALMMQEDCDIDIWSTSCWYDFKKAKKICALKEKHEHSPAILHGTIYPETGYSIITTQRNSMNGKVSKNRIGHVDWWIFKNIDVSQNFSIMEEI